MSSPWNGPDDVRNLKPLWSGGLWEPETITPASASNLFTAK